MVLKKEIEEFLKMELQTVLRYKQVMEFMCLNCRLNCNEEKKLNCVQFVLERVTDEINN